MRIEVSNDRNPGNTILREDSFFASFPNHDPLKKVLFMTMGGIEESY
jgi:hypothetical protein